MQEEKKGAHVGAHFLYISVGGIFAREFSGLLKVDTAENKFVTATITMQRCSNGRHETISFVDANIRKRLKMFCTVVANCYGPGGGEGGLKVLNADDNESQGRHQPTSGFCAERAH